MKILTVIHLYPPHHLGGYEVACQSVMERFAERGHEVEVLTANQRMDGVEEISSPVRVHRTLRECAFRALDHDKRTELRFLVDEVIVFHERVRPVR